MATSSEPAPQTAGALGSSPLVAETSLRSGALGFPGVLMQAVTGVAPAAGLLLTVQFTAGLAGVASPLAYLCAALILLMLSVSVSELAKYLPSAGGYYTYVSRTVHPRAGFMTGWLYFLYTPVIPAANNAFMGFVLQSVLKEEYDITLKWWWYALVATAVTFVFAYRGIAPSIWALVVLGIIEISVVGILSIWGLFSPGDGGVNLSSFNPGNSPSWNGFYLAIVFSLFIMTGWEGAAAVAEESQNPRRFVPRALVLSVIIVGVFDVICFWLLLVGWGTDNLSSFVNNPELPMFTLARQFWGGAWILVLIALQTSIFGGSLAATNVTTRMFFGMGRSGSLPRQLAVVHPKFKTPVNAVYLQTLITLAIVLGLGFWIGPDQVFFLAGLVVTLALIVVYSAGNIGVFRFYRSEHRSEFRPTRHLVFPAIATAALIWVGYKSLHPLPASPVKWAPLVAGCWFLLGLAVLLWFKWSGREAWLHNAGAAVNERPETPEEAAHRPAI